ADGQPRPRHGAAGAGAAGPPHATGRSHDGDGYPQRGGCRTRGPDLPDRGWPPRRGARIGRDQRVTLLRGSLRHLLRHPWRAALSVLGIALGVAAVVSVDLASASARRAFTLAAEGVTGRATHEIVGGPNGLDERVAPRLARELGVHPLAPVIEA